MAYNCSRCLDKGTYNAGEGSTYCPCPAGHSLYALTHGHRAPLHDSGKRVSFTTGAVRDTAAGKGRFDLLPPYPLQELARHYENGAVKYAARNWEKGIPLGRMIDSAMRHLNQWRMGDRSEPHLIASIWNLMGLVHMLHEIEEGRLPESLDDNNYLQRAK